MPDPGTSFQDGDLGTLTSYQVPPFLKEIHAVLDLLSGVTQHKVAFESELRKGVF